MKVDFLEHRFFPGIFHVFVEGHYEGNASRVFKPNPEWDAFHLKFQALSKEEQHHMRYPPKQVFSHYKAQSALELSNPTLFNFAPSQPETDEQLAQYLISCNSTLLGA